MVVPSCHRKGDILVHHLNAARNLRRFKPVIGIGR